MLKCHRFHLRTDRRQKNEVVPLKERRFYIRVGVPICIVLGTMVVSMITYKLSGRFESETIRFLVADISAAFLFVSIWLGGLVANSLCFFLGANFRERFLASLVTPFVWGAKYLFTVWGVYSLGETLYMLLCPIVIGCPVVAVLCI